MVLLEILKSIRPQQWLKNFFIFGPLLFSELMFDIPSLFKAILAFVVFCLLSGSLYILNDIRDIEEDKQHPIKSRRPIPSGKLKKSHAMAAFFVLSVVSMNLAIFVNWKFVLTAGIYYVLQLGYSLGLKHVVILDVFIIAAGFLIRVMAGALAIEVYMSPWLLLCTLQLALFLAMSKRRHELALLKESAGDHRPILKEYSLNLLDQMIAVVTASTVIAYCLYTISEETVAKFGTTNLIYTVPFVLYGIFRYLYLVHQRFGGGSPEVLIIKDKPLLVVLFLWILSAVVILYV